MPKKLNSRQKARRLAVQLLYAWMLSGNAIRSVLEDVTLTLLANESDESDEPEQFASFHQGYERAYISQVLEMLPGMAGELDGLIAPFLSARDLSEVNPVEHAILRLAFFELKCRPDIPHKVVINEFIDISKEFGADQSHKFINGVLDRAWRRVRATTSSSGSG